MGWIKELDINLFKEITLNSNKESQTEIKKSPRMLDLENISSKTPNRSNFSNALKKISPLNMSTLFDQDSKKSSLINKEEKIVTRIIFSF